MLILHHEGGSTSFFEHFWSPKKNIVGHVIHMTFLDLSLYIKQPIKLVVTSASSGYKLSLSRVPHSCEMVGLELEKEAKF